MTKKIVVPGEKLVSGEEYLPGDGTIRIGKDIKAVRFGLSEENGRLVKIIPLSGVFMPRRGNLVIGKVLDITFNGWIVDIDAPYQAFLPLSECPRYVNRKDLAEFLDIGDMLTAKINDIKSRGIDLTIMSRGLGKLENGMIIKTNSNKVPRIIGKEGSMINLIKKETKTDITVGQNGIIWIKGEKIEDELFAKQAIFFVSEKSFVEGLTEKVEEFLKKYSKDKKQKTIDKTKKTKTTEKPKEKKK